MTFLTAVAASSWAFGSIVVVTVRPWVLISVSEIPSFSSSARAAL